QHPFMTFVGFPERAEHVNRLAVFLVVFPNSFGDRLTQLIPKRLNPLPVLSSQQREQQLTADRQRNQLGRRNTDLVNPVLNSTEHVDLAALSSFAANVQARRRQRFDIAADRALMQIAKPQVADKVISQFIERSTKSRRLEQLHYLV